MTLGIILLHNRQVTIRAIMGMITGGIEAINFTARSVECFEWNGLLRKEQRGRILALWQPFTRSSGKLDLGNYSGSRHGVTGTKTMHVSAETMFSSISGSCKDCSKVPSLRYWHLSLVFSSTQDPSGPCAWHSDSICAEAAISISHNDHHRIA